MNNLLTDHQKETSTLLQIWGIAFSCVCNSKTQCLRLCFAKMFRVSSVLLAFWAPCLGKRELVFVLIVHLFVSYAHFNICRFFSFSWCRGLTAASACGSSWTFLFNFLHTRDSVSGNRSQSVIFNFPFASLPHDVLGERKTITLTRVGMKELLRNLCLTKVY